MASPANFTLAELGANAKKGHATWWSVNPELLAPLAKLLYTNTGGIGTTFVPVGEKTAILFMEAAIMDGSQAMRLEVAGELLKALEGARNVIGAAVDSSATSKNWSPILSWRRFTTVLPSCLTPTTSATSPARHDSCSARRI